MTNVTYELNVDAEGNLVLPLELREALGLQAGDTLKVMQTEDHLLLIPKRLLVPEFADYMSKLLAEKGLTVSDLLASGEEIRDELFEERYGDLLSD
jgi:AbrB family looped-hinge helix DNA binding protein